MECAVNIKFTALQSTPVSKIKIIFNTIWQKAVAQLKEPPDFTFSPIPPRLLSLMVGPRPSGVVIYSLHAYAITITSVMMGILATIQLNGTDECPLIIASNMDTPYT